MKIAVTGPECSGKTTMARWISSTFQMALIDEYAREYLEQLAAPYHLDDVIHIAREQHNRIMMSMANNIVADTESLVSKIWIQEKFEKNFDWLDDQIHKENFDVYLLCTPDILWEPDPLRENPHDRYRLFGLYQKELQNLKLPHLVLEGSLQKRQEVVENWINQFKKLGLG